MGFIKAAFIKDFHKALLKEQSYTFLDLFFISIQNMAISR